MRLRGIFKVEEEKVIDPYSAVPDETPLREVLVLSGDPLSPTGVCTWVYVGLKYRVNEKWLEERFGRRLTDLSEIPPSVLLATVRNSSGQAIRLCLQPGKPDIVVGENPEKNNVIVASPVMARGRVLGWSVKVFEDGRWLDGNELDIPKGAMWDLMLEIEREIRGRNKLRKEQEELGNIQELDLGNRM